MTVDLAHRRYLMRTAAFMGGYAAINLAAIFGAFDGLSRLGGWLLGLAVAAPVAGQLWATLALMHDGDEFVRAVTAKRFILSSGIAMTLACAWGYMETYAHAPHVAAWLIYPLFWAVFGVVAPFVRTSRG